MNKHVEFLNKDNRMLRGYINIPENFNGELIVMFHGFTGNKTEHNGHFRTLTRMLDPMGIGTLRMDFSGNGESDGEFLDFTFDTLMNDARLMVEFALGYEGVKKVDLLGFSMGGAVAGYMSKEYADKINKVVLWSPAGDMVQKIKTRYESYPKDENENGINSCWSLSKAMYETAQQYDLYNGLENFKGKVFIVHGNKDLAVNYLIGIQYSVIYPDAFIHLVHGAGHGYDKPEDMKELYEKTLSFLK